MFQGLIAKILVLLVILSLGALAHSNPRLRQVVPIVATPIILNSTPIRLSIIFSEPVYGFTQQDIYTNGRILTLEGRGATYTVLIIATTPQLIVDIYTDSVHNIRKEGNELSPIPFIATITEDGSLVVVQSLQTPILFSAAVAPPPVVEAPPPPPPPPPVVEAPPPPPPPVVEAPPPEPAPSPPAVEEEAEEPVITEPPKPRAVQFNLALNIGVYPDAPPFFNIESQTNLEPEQTNEITLGAEIFHRPKIWPWGLGYFAQAGYQQSSYSSTAQNEEASYTAIPLELGATVYFSNYLSASLAAIMHFTGEYIHTGTIGEGRVDDLAIAVANGANSYGSGLPGITFDLSFNYNFFGASLRFLSLPLNNFEEMEEVQNQLMAAGVARNIDTLNAIETTGLFFEIKI